MWEMLKNLAVSFFRFLSSLTWLQRRHYVIIGEGVIILLFIQALCFAPDAVVKGQPTGISSPSDTRTASDALIIVDRNSVDLFEQIPEEYIQAASNLGMLFLDRSVGWDIDNGLTCLSYPSDEDAPFGCSRTEHRGDPSFPADPSEVNWFRPGGYNRDNWDFIMWPQPGCSDWYGKVDCFFTITEPVIDQYDVVSFQFSYLAVGNGSSIVDQPGGFFWDNSDRQDVYDHEAYETQHSDKTFIYWTSSLSRSIGTPESETFNNQMRQYASDNNKILFDVADIESHDPDGNLCYDNRDGVPYSDAGYNSENHPDDGLDIPAICPHYTTNVDGGHLRLVSAGKIRVAKAFWVLMAQIAGWDPGSTSTPPSVQSVVPVNGATDVPLNRSLVIDFSEAMSTSTVVYTLTPNSGGLTPSWNGSNTQLTLTHNNFVTNTNYTAAITAGTDLDGESLDNAPYTWVFTTSTQLLPELEWIYLPVVMKNLSPNSNMTFERQTFNCITDKISDIFYCYVNELLEIILEIRSYLT